MKSLISLAMLAVVLVGGCIPGVGERPQVPDAQSAAEVQVTPEPTPASVPTPEPEPPALPAAYDYTAPVPQRAAVDEAWFSDAVFIGDSRTDGLRLYSGLKGCDFLCYKGLSVFGVMSDKPVVQTPQGTVSVFQALGKKQYAKVYLMLGLNELGHNNDQGFADTYRAVVDKLIQLQPEADIYLQPLVPVNTQVCQQTNQPYYITNAQIAVYNEIIRDIAAEKEVYLVDVSAALVDETGELPADASADGIHFRKEGYKAWYEYLKTHTVERVAEEETP